MIKRIFLILILVLGVLMILGGAFGLCWPSIVFLAPFFGVCIAVGVVTVFVMIIVIGLNWSLEYLE